ncbi:hypothetical protein SY2F82_34760 [Streptomyces sp. Y2F8-2]|nr:hypothetical protein SY2F82_34760 [Streptomyces sp. Y2F8-2]
MGRERTLPADDDLIASHSPAPPQQAFSPHLRQSPFNATRRHRNTSGIRAAERERPACFRSGGRRHRQSHYATPVTPLSGHGAARSGSECRR